jgi:hypothetical protein
MESLPRVGSNHQPLDRNRSLYLTVERASQLRHEGLNSSVFLELW